MPGPLQFVVRVAGKFLANKGLLLASAVAYNALLSAIPIAAVLAVVLSQFMDGEAAVEAISMQLGWIAPTEAASIAGDLATFLDDREVVGGVGAVVLLFFSALAFRMLDQAFESIFGEHPPRSGRHYWLRVTLPYVLVMLLCIGVVTLTLLTTWIEAVAGETVAILGRSLALPNLHGLIWMLLGFAVQAVVFTALYLIMPSSRVSLRSAAIGGASAALMWEITRRVMVWYFANVSLVGVIYGSLTTVVVILLMMEAAAIIVLLGAQVIAELGGDETITDPQAGAGISGPLYSSSDGAGEASGAEHTDTKAARVAREREPLTSTSH